MSISSCNCGQEQNPAWAEHDLCCPVFSEGAAATWHGRFIPMGMPPEQIVSLRDRFAGQAMAAIVSRVGLRAFPNSEVALAAYRMADDMLKARGE